MRLFKITSRWTLDSDARTCHVAADTMAQAIEIGERKFKAPISIAELIEDDLSVCFGDAYADGAGPTHGAVSK